jgi:hypothetical protein
MQKKMLANPIYVGIVLTIITLIIMILIQHPKHKLTFGIVMKRVIYMTIANIIFMCYVYSKNDIPFKFGKLNVTTQTKEIPDVFENSSDEFNKNSPDKVTNNLFK